MTITLTWILLIRKTNRRSGMMMNRSSKALTQLKNKRVLPVMTIVAIKALRTITDLWT